MLQNVASHATFDTFFISRVTREMLRWLDTGGATGIIFISRVTREMLHPM